MNELANLRAEISTIRRDERIRRDENRSYIENEYYLDKKKFLQLKEKVDLMMEKGIVQPEVLDELKYRVNRYRRTPYNSTELSDLVGRYETLYRIADEFVNSTSDNEKQNERNA